MVKRCETGKRKSTKKEGKHLSKCYKNITDQNDITIWTIAIKGGNSDISPPTGVPGGMPRRGEKRTRMTQSAVAVASYL